MGRPSKQFKKFASSGKLTETIKKRRTQKESKRKFESQVAQRQHQRGAPRPEHALSDDEDEDADDDINPRKVQGGKVAGVAKTVDELFGAGGLDVPIDDPSDLEDLSEDEDEEDDDEEEEGEGEDEDDEEMDEAAMAKAMAELEKKDPEFFKHLKAEDPSLLSFGKGKGRADAMEEDDEDEDDDEDDEDIEMDEDEEDDDTPAPKIIVTMKMLRLWRESMLKVSGYFLLGRQPLIRAAVLAPLAPQDDPGVPCRRAHERGRGGAG